MNLMTFKVSVTSIYNRSPWGDGAPLQAVGIPVMKYCFKQKQKLHISHQTLPSVITQPSLLVGSNM